MNIQELNDCSIVDIETTGLSPDKDDIIEIGALRVRNNLVVAEFTQLIKASKPLSKTISQITGITDDMLADAKELDDTLSDFLRFIDNDTVVGHNIAFDANFISKKCVACELDFKNDTYDTLAVCKHEYPDVSHKLEDMIIQLGIKDSGIHHRALADCYHTHSLMTALKNHSALVLEIKPPKQRVLNPITKGLQTLHGILIGITCDDILTQEELLGLEEWMINNEQLAGNYPYDIINNAIWKVIEDGIIEQSELDYLLEFFKTQIDPQTAEKSTRRALTEEEQSWITDTPHRAQTAAMIMMYAGLRRGELLALTWQDIDLDAHTIKVERSVSMIKGKPHIKEGGKTDAATRTVYIPGKLVNYLRSTVHNPIGLVCPTVKGSLMTETGFSRMWESYLNDLNIKYGNWADCMQTNGKCPSKYAPIEKPFLIPRITPHWLRHTFITLMYLAGVDVLTAKEQAGHADIKTTMAIYTHLDEKYKKKSINKLDEYLESIS